MNLRFELAIHLNGRTIGQKGLLMANWSDDAVAKLKLKQEAQSQKDARFLEEQIIKKTQGLSFWG